MARFAIWKPHCDCTKPACRWLGGDRRAHLLPFSLRPHRGPGGYLPLLAGWPNAVGTLLTYRDANLENLRGMEQWIHMGQAPTWMSSSRRCVQWVSPGSIPLRLIATGTPCIAISPWCRTSPSQVQQLYSRPASDSADGTGFTVTMDGSDSACEWGNDPDTAEGIFGYDNLPKLETRELWRQCQ